MDFVKRMLNLSFVPSGWLTVLSGWMLVIAALICWSDTLSALLPFIDCKVVAGIAGGTGLVGIRRAISAARAK